MSLSAGVLVACLSMFGTQLAAQSATPPNFSPNSMTGWISLSFDRFIPPPTGPGPITVDPAHPYVSNGDLAATGAQPTFLIADLNNPILQPWVRDELLKRNQAILAGKPGYTRQASCVPNGFPAFLLHPVTPLYIIQTAKLVYMINQENLDPRRIYLDVPHSSNPKPSWYGESVGHYEGDTLVIDTIGISNKTYIDHFWTPHTDNLHVIERFRMIDNGMTLEVNVRFEDSGAFTMPWNAIQRWRRVAQGPILERICAENPANYFNEEKEPIPQDDTPDF